MFHVKHLVKSQKYDLKICFLCLDLITLASFEVKSVILEQKYTNVVDLEHFYLKKVLVLI